MTSPCARGAALRRALFLASAAAALTAAPALAAAPAGSDPAPEGFDIGGSFRVTAEAIDGQFRPNKAADDAFVSFRTVILASYSTGPLRLLGELVDARAYGTDLDTPIGTTDVNALEPLQFYAGLDLGELVGRGVSGSVKAGRFTMDIGSGRLVSRSDSNYTSAFTGTMADVRMPGDSRLQAFWTMPNIRLPNDPEGLVDNEVEFDRATTDLQFYGAHYSRPLFGGAGGELYVYQLDEEDADGYPTRNRDLLTYGLRVSRAAAANRVDFDLEFARQTGEVRATPSPVDVTDIDVDAYFFHAQLGYRHGGSWSPRLSLHFDVASGDDGDGGDYNRFDPLFGGRRNEFGPLTIFGPAGRSNIVSPGLRLEAKPDPRIELMTMYRALWLEEATDVFAMTGVRDPSGASGTWAGNQIEARVKYWAVPDRVKLEAGAAYLDKGRFLTDAPNAPQTGDTRHAYVSMQVNF